MPVPPKGNGLSSRALKTATAEAFMSTDEIDTRPALSLSPHQAETVRGAIAHALRRVVTDPDFEFHMFGTETLHRLCAAYDVLDGRVVGATRAELVARGPAPGSCRCADNADRVRELEEQLLASARRSA